jgi:cell wall-associated NlpC family hydrolase/DNA-binding CsgD family transcriptional regulator
LQQRPKVVVTGCLACVSPSEVADDALIKPASIETQFVNRPRQGNVTHIVQEGETIGSISEAYNISIDTVAWANNINTDDTLQAGQQLAILPVSGILHEVKDGETIEGLAEKYQSDQNAIIDYNQMTDPKHLVAGDKLVIPGGRLDEAGRMEASARSNSRPGASDGQTPDGNVAQAKPMRAFKYEVSSGDTLSAIAERNGISVDTIMANNNLSSSDKIKPGDELTIVPVNGVQYTVAKGDTISEIAEVLGADAKEILKANAMSDSDSLSIGQKLVVPGGKFPAPVVVAAAQQPAAVSGPSALAKPAAPPPAQDSAPAAKPAAPSVSAPPPTNGSKGSAIVSYASKYLGYPYVWGGSGPGGFDCSGFTWYIYSQAGAYIPNHDLWGQVQAGPRVKQADLVAGDLVFFQNTYTYGLSHVGIYIGGGRFIHAASERSGVRVDALSDSYWGPRYYGASRPW